MARPEIGQALPRAADAYSTVKKWELWILAEEHHGPDWRRVFGPVDPEAVWSTLASAVMNAPVVSIRPRGEHGFTCGVNASLTLNARTATVRSAWHYAHDDAAPRLVTAFPTT